MINGDNLMKDFTYSYPTKVYFGKNSAKKAFDEELGKFGKTVMLAYGEGVIKRNGIYEEIHSLLLKADKKIIEFPGIMPNPTYKKVQDGVKIAREYNADLIIAVGGGSVIDCCKVIAAQTLLSEDIWNMEYKNGIFPKSGIPVGAVVTASGTGAEMNAGGVITHEEKNWKGGIFGVAPSFAILDPYHTLTVPEIQVFSGAFDTLSHAMETYLGNSDCDNVSDDIALAVMHNTVVNMRRLMKDINDIEARSNLMWDSAMAENGILKCGRSTDFQVHQIEHQLGAFTDCNHGQGLAVIQPIYCRHILCDAEKKLTRFAKAVFDVDTADNGIDALQALISECGLPSKLGQIRSKCEITPKLLREVADTCNIIKSNPRTIDHDEIYAILNECL